MICEACNRTFKSTGGLKNHQRACKAKETELPPTEPTTSEPVNWKPFEKDVCDAYEKITVWRRNVFTLPKGKAGKNFIQELTATIELWNSNCPLRGISLKMLMILPNLLLLITHKNFN